MEITNKLLDLQKTKSTVIGLYNIDVNSFSKELNKYLSNNHNKKVRFNKMKYVSIIDSNKLKFNTKSIKDEIDYMCALYKVRKKTFRDTLEKMLEALNLDNDILNRKINELSRSESYKLYLSINAIINKDAYIFNDFTKYLDRNGIKDFFKLIDILKANEKIIFIADKDINIIYNYTKNMIYDKKDELYFVDTTTTLTDVNELIKENLPIPTLVKITYLARNDKNVRLSYHKDVRDIMKDIYKHV